MVRGLVLEVEKLVKCGWDVLRNRDFGLLAW
jgi:hypothetical protein